ncbi:MarR family transcriptional regulator [Pseudonocardia yuanmonensis]|uniref:MarR family transcriptional regulator n=1 Tax=Pseudonocardia yuanmonensis TaxID=1095914 RepID=A0ABP8W9I2_9PSEU
MLLEDQLCFALYAASRAVTAVYRPLLDELGLTYPQYLVMLVLWERGSLSVKEVSTALHLDYGTVTPLLKRLEALGLVSRRRRTDDERGVEVALTDRGRKLRERAGGVPVELGRAFGLDPADRGALRDTLVVLTRSLTDHAQAAGRRSA